MILSIARTALVALKRDRASLVLSFVLPVSFFSIFAMVFGGQHDTTPKVHVIVVDEDRTATSQKLVAALKREGSLVVLTQSSSKDKSVERPDYTAATAEAAVKAGDAPIALILPAGYGAHPIAFGGQEDGQQIQMLNDASDMIAPQIVFGLLQKVAMTAMPSTMAEEGMKMSGQYMGGLTPQQQKLMDDNLAQLRERETSGELKDASGGGSNGFAGIVQVKQRSVVGGAQKDNIVSFYAAAVGVMFLMFTASGAAGSLLDEAESGALDRVLSTRVTMTTLLAGKLFYNSALAFTQLTVMFLWAWIVFKVDLPGHIPGFLVMGVTTAVTVASFGILLASICRTRAQLGAVSTLLILVMSSIGGSMFPRFLMSEAMQRAGLFTINAWAIDGFTKVFWRDMPVEALWPQVGVLVGIAVVLFAVARRVARRWDYA